VIKSSSKEKPKRDGVIAEVYQNSKEGITSMDFKLVQEI
jgi:hypothetical protein